MTILLVRHCAVAKRWQGICYGQSDIGLSREGKQEARRLAEQLAYQPITAIIHSGLKRTAILAQYIAQRIDIEPSVDTRWQERNFGSWEGRSWNAIYRKTGNAMDQMLTDPAHFQPGGGETTNELSARVMAAWQDVPVGRRIIIISHGGPIAMVRRNQAGAVVAEVAHYIPPVGSVTQID